MTSSVTILIIHLTKLGDQAGLCPTIPEAIHEECKAKYLPLKTRRGVARASEEVVPSDCDLSDSGDDASPAASVASGVAASSGGGSSSSSKKKASSQGGRPPKQAKQGTLAQVEAMAKDTLERAVEPNLDLKSYLQEAYMHPIFKEADDADSNSEEFDRDPPLVPLKHPLQDGTSGSSACSETRMMIRYQ
ncbi:hypothetical protein L7F22_045126 [Adiantum nelumboides]|nr:hypothetical protein [Adiantum nelumboides]